MLAVIYYYDYDDCSDNVSAIVVVMLPLIIVIDVTAFKYTCRCCKP